MTDPQPIGPAVREYLEDLRQRRGLGPMPEPGSEEMARLEREDALAARREALEWLLSAVPKEFKEASISDFRPQVRKVAQAWVDDPAGIGGLLVLGPLGTGKTHLLWALYKALAERGGPRMRVTKVVRLMRELKPGGEEADNPAAIARLREVPVLAFDDLGVETHTAWERLRLYELVDARYEDRLPTLVSANLPIRDEAHREKERKAGHAIPALEDAVGERVVSRLVGTSQIVKLVGKDRRRER